MYKERKKRIDWYLRQSKSFDCSVMGLLIAIVAAVAWIFLVDVPQAAVQTQKANAQVAAIRSHLRREDGVIINRGPYQGDAADVSYRLVSIQYKDWSGHPVTTERLLPWSAHQGEKIAMTVRQTGEPYIAADLNNPWEAKNPWYPKPSWSIWGSIIAGIVMALLVWFLAAHLAYRYWVVKTIAQNRKSSLQTA